MRQQPGVPARRGFQDLESALPQVLWDCAQRGPLLIVDPRGTVPVALEAMRSSGVSMMPALEPPPPAGPEGYQPSELGDFFGRKVVRFGSVSAFVPTVMSVINTRPGPPDLFAGLPSDKRLRLFESLLSPRQWRQLASPDGLGVADLNLQQQRLFLSLLPDPFTAQKATYRRGVMRQEGSTTLTPEQRAQVRIRIRRDFDLSFPNAESSDYWVRFGQGRIVPENAVILSVRTTPESMRGSGYGVPLIERVPNRPKPCQLDFDSPVLNARISLKKEREGAALPPTAALPYTPHPTAALTVGDLVRRAGEAARVELYADPRAAALPVIAYGGSARAGDVLRALCMAVTGTFRKVGPAFVLTDDLAGIGARMERLREWGEDARAQEAAVTKDLEKRFGQAAPEQYLDFDSDSLPLPREKMRSLPLRWARFDQMADEFALSDLSPDWQSKVRDYVRSGNAMTQSFRLPGGTENGPHSYAARDDRLRIQALPRLSYVVPGLGVVEDGTTMGGFEMTNAPPLDALDRKPPSTAQPPPKLDLSGFAMRAVRCAPASADEAAQWAEAARRIGFTHLWIDVPEKGGAQTLAGAVKAAHDRGLGPVAVVPALWRSAAADAGGDAPDINIVGETNAAYTARRMQSPAAKAGGSSGGMYGVEPGGDWLRADDTGVSVDAKRRVLEAAAVPGLAALVLARSAAPGYNSAGDDMFDYFVGDFGYTLSNRLALLRQTGLDPIDLPVSLGLHTTFDLPFFSEQRLRPRYVQSGGDVVPETNAKTPAMQWNEIRFEMNYAFMADLFTALRGAQPTLPLLLDSRSDPRITRGRFAAWTGLEEVRQRVRHGPASKQPEGPRGFYTFDPFRWPQQMATSPDDSTATPTAPADYASALARWAERQKGHWDGIVLDLTALPSDNGLEMLGGLPGR